MLPPVHLSSVVCAAEEMHVAEEMLFPTLPILPPLPRVPEGWICSSISRDGTGHSSPGPLQLGKQESGQPWPHLWAAQDKERLIYLETEG